MRFNINDYKGKYAMHCETIEETKDFFRFMDEHKLEWDIKNPSLYTNNIISSAGGGFFDFNEGKIGSFNNYYSNNYTILKWCDFMDNKFTRNNLKHGDVLLIRDSRIAILDFEKFDKKVLDFKNDMFGSLSLYNQDLTSFMNYDYDIMQVRRPTEPQHCSFDAFEKKCGELIYKREESVEGL